MASAYGWTHQQILSLTTKQFWMYVEQVTWLEARSQSMQFEVATFPYMKAGDRRQVVHKYNSYLREPIIIQPTQQEVETSWKILRDRQKHGN